MLSVTINGYTLPSCDMDKAKRNIYKTWSENSGRSASGDACGDIKYRESKLSLRWHILTAAQKRTIERLFLELPAFFTATYVLDGESVTTKFYSGDFDYQSTIECSDGTYYVDCSIDLVESEAW